MNYSQLPSAMGLTPQSLGQNAVGYITNESIDGKWVTLFRPNKYRINDEAFMQRFRELGQVATAIRDPHVMRPTEYVADEQGGYYSFGVARYITLGQLLMEKPAIVADSTWTDAIIHDLMHALEHLHKKGLMAVELTPQSVLVSRTGQNTLMLMPPLSGFLDIRRDVWTSPNDFLAPELFSDDNTVVVDQRADIYGAARIVQRLFHFSELPLRLRHFVKACTQDDVAARPEDDAMAQDILTKVGRQVRLLKTVLAIVAGLFIIGLVMLGLSRNGTDYDFQETDPLSTDSFGLQLRSDNALMPDVEQDIFAEDTTFLNEDTTISLSPERRKAEKQRMERATEAYRQQYERMARAILTPVYTYTNLHGEQQHFLILSTQAMQKLQDLAISMQKQYQLDPTTAEAVAGEVIGKVTDELKQKAN